MLSKWILTIKILSEKITKCIPIIIPTYLKTLSTFNIVINTNLNKTYFNKN